MHRNILGLPIRHNVMGMVLLWIGCAIAASIVSSNKGKDWLGGALLGFLLGPIGLLITLVSSTDQAQLDSASLASGLNRKCPFCAELVRAEAKKCRHCGSELPPLPPQS